MQRAFDLFEEKLGVQQILKPEEVTVSAAGCMCSVQAHKRVRKCSVYKMVFEIHRRHCFIVAFMLLS